ncbi:MAG: discoidin domain-containing protein, partial [Candidatus Aminicenantes bacterium]|nr:discoidin domain-containing protein [Candidatus Aminicenantes bacterium]
RAVFREFPSQGATDILQQWKVKYVVFHAKDPGGRPRPHFLDSASWSLIYNLRLVRSFRYGFHAPNSLDAYWGEDYIFEVLPPGTQPVPLKQSVELPPGRWAARADLQPELVPRLKDGRMDTVWTTGRSKQNEDFINIVLDEPRAVDRIEIPLGTFIYDWAVNIQINVSLDGNNWWIGYPGYSPGEFARDLVDRPYQSVQTIRLLGQKIRYLKIINVGRAHENYWSIPEIKIFVVTE